MSLESLQPVVSENKKEGKSEKLSKSLEEAFSQLPNNIKEECLEEVRKLPEEILERIESLLVDKAQPKGMMVKGTAEMLRKIFKEDRMKDGAYRREDLVDLGETKMELDLNFDLERLFSKYAKEEIVSVDSYEAFKEVLEIFVDRIWYSRGEEKFWTPERDNLQEMDEERNRILKALSKARQDEKDLRERVGEKQRLPNAIQEELRTLSGVVMSLQRELKSNDFKYMDMRGERYKALEYDNFFKASVYISEYFSAENFAIITLEVLEVSINHASRFDRNAHPELLDFNRKFFQEWALEHAHDEALIKRKDESKPKRIEVVLQRFIGGLKSYITHKDNEELTEANKESMVNELPMILGMLRRVSV